MAILRLFLDSHFGKPEMGNWHDTKTDATKFAEAYRRVLAVKYVGAPTATRVVQDGGDLSLVEDGDEAAIDSLLKVVRKAKT